MVKCPSCERDNVEDANFCVKCGAVIGNQRSGWSSAEFETRARDFAKDMERYGKEAGRKAEAFAKGLIRDVEKIVQGRSVCEKCGSSWPGAHDYCAKCGSKIE